MGSGLLSRANESATLSMTPGWSPSRAHSYSAERVASARSSGHARARMSPTSAEDAATGSGTAAAAAAARGTASGAGPG